MAPGTAYISNGLQQMCVTKQPFKPSPGAILFSALLRCASSLSECMPTCMSSIWEHGLVTEFGC